MKNWLFLLLLALRPAAPANAQTYFNERYTNQGRQSGALVTLPTDSGYFVGGQAVMPTFDMAVQIRRLDPRGRQVNTRTYSRPGYGYFAPAGGSGLLPVGKGFVMAGTLNCPAPGREQYAMLWRLNANGDTLWTRRYAQPQTRYTGYSVCRTHDGGFALIGTVGTPNNSVRFALIRTDSLGHELWQQSYGVQLVNYGYTVAETADHGFLLAGFTRPNSGPNGYTQGYLVKTDSVGTQQWQRRFGQNGLFNGTVIAKPSRDGNLLVAGTYSQRVIGSFTQLRPILYKLDPQGQTIWQKEIGPARNGQEFYSIHELPDGSIVVAGQRGDPTNATPNGNGFQEGVIYKVCPDGDSLWLRSYKKLAGGRSSNFLRDLQPTPDGGFVGSGFLFVSAPDTGTSDTWVFKIDSAGYLQAGGAPVTVQCRPITGTSADSPAETRIDLYPNPTAPDGRFALQAPPGAILSLTDALGRQIWTRQHLGPRTSDLKLPHPGLYLLRLQWPDGHSVTRKVVRE